MLTASKELPTISGSSSNGDSGRDSSGRFTAGNPGGPGDPYARKVGEPRRVLVEQTTEDDMRQIARERIEGARNGSLPHVKELFDRLWGKSRQAVEAVAASSEEAGGLGGNLSPERQADWDRLLGLVDGPQDDRQQPTIAVASM